LPAPASADILNVLNLNDSGAGSLRQAIADATPGSTINVPAGTIPLGSPLIIAKDLTVQGQCPATTVLSGGGATGVLSVAGPATVNLINLGVRDAAVTGAIADGAGMVMNGAPTVKLSHTAWTNNVANARKPTSGGIGQGGAIYVASGALTIEDSSFVGNQGLADGAPGYAGGIAQGGAIYQLAGSLSIARSNLSGNSTDASGGDGASNPGNSGGIGQGGAIYQLGSTADTLNLTDTTVSGNSVDASAGPGGNAGIGQAGGIYVLDSNQQDNIVNSTIAANVARALGSGGIANAGGYYRLSSSKTMFDSSTIAGNRAEGTTPTNGNINAPTIFRNSIISGGQAMAGAENCSGASTSLGHNIEDKDQCGLTQPSDQKNTDPRLGSVQDNGGPGPTVGFGLDSPAFDRGDASTCRPADERGVGRPQAGGCDVGAFELEVADLGLRGSQDKSRLKLGSKVTFTVSASNGGSGTGHTTTITDALPAGLALVSATLSSGGCSGTTSVACVLGELGAGGSGAATIVARAIKPGTQSNTVSIGSSTVDPASGNNAVPFSLRVDKLAFAAATVSPRTFRLGPKLPKLSKVRTGTTIRFRLPEAARVRLTFLKHKRGKRFARRGVLSVRGHAGLNKLRFQGRLSRRKSLAPGRYRLTLRATDPFGNRSAIKKLSFTLLPPS
jgi:uncharacterized repeat protein (TIGR01451 family)